VPRTAWAFLFRRGDQIVAEDSAPEEGEAAVAVPMTMAGKKKALQTQRQPLESQAREDGRI
jgi:hypothetical protein